MVLYLELLPLLPLLPLIFLSLNRLLFTGDGTNILLMREGLCGIASLFSGDDFLDRNVLIEGEPLNEEVV